MKISRASEHRAGGKKYVLYSSSIVVAIFVGLLVSYFVSQMETSSATGDHSGVAQEGLDKNMPNSGNTANGASAAVVPTPTPVSTPIPSPTLVQEPVTPDHDSLTKLVPDVRFGEVIAEGFVELELPGKSPNNLALTWYTFQVDTKTRDITLFFALFNESLDSLTRTVYLDDYTQGSQLQKAELTLFYTGGPERVLNFDREEGTISLTQQYQQPHGPSLFSPELRVALVKPNMVLHDATGSISTRLQLDLTGLTDSEEMVFQLSSPEGVQDVLFEIQALVNQIESKRTRL